MRVLIIDNNIRPEWWGADDLRKLAVEAGTTAYVRRGPHGDLPTDLTHFDKIIISGSVESCLNQPEWVMQLDQLIKKAASENKHMLGICYGHQSIVRALASVSFLSKAKIPEYGWSKIEKLASSKLFEGLGESFHSFSSHVEEVTSLPAGFKLLARSERCEIQAFEVEGKPIFGIQFHPERDLDDANEGLAEKRKKGYAKLLINPNDGKRLYDPEVGRKIFGNFFSYG